MRGFGVTPRLERPSSRVLMRLMSACRQGVNKYPQIPSEDIFNARLEALVATRFNSRDRRCLARVEIEGSRGLVSARRRDAEAARVHFAAGRRLLATLKFGSHAAKLAESMFFAQQAYELYVRRRFANALAMLERSFVNDLALEEELGFDILKIHRIQLLGNWMRLEEERGHWRRGVELGIMQLQYLEAPDAGIFRSLPPPWNRGWNGRHNNIPLELIAKMHRQTSAQTISLFAGTMAAEPSSSGISRVISHAMRRGRTTTQIGRWLTFQSARLNKSAEECCRAASAGLRRGSIPSSPLWLSIAEDVEALLYSFAAQSG
jgi:hypothetical protein